MRILAVSVAPLFPGFVMGGSQRVLMDVAAGLGEAGHEVRLLCSRRPENAEGFSPAPRVTVEPSLRLKGSFPAPYETSPHNLAATWNALTEAAAWADRVYLHADAVYMREALGDKPIVRSLHDFVYEEALASAFTLPAARTIVPSDYLRRCIAASASKVADVGELVVVPNGVRIPAESPPPAAPPGIAQRRAGDLILLHPHRLQPKKGLRESMLIAVELQRRMPGRRVRLLVPAYPEGESLDEATDSLEAIKRMAAETGAGDTLEPHAWLSPGAMPGYYAFGDVTLCPGSFVESFGLVPVESAVAGTPAVCSLSGAFRDLTGIPGIAHVEHGDIAKAADAVAALLGQPPDMAAGRVEIGRRFGFRQMVQGYVDAITGPLPLGGASPAAYGTSDGSLALAPWCHISGARIYHDYLAAFEQFPLLAAALGSGDGRLSRSIGDGSLATEIERAIERGFLVTS